MTNAGSGVLELARAGDRTVVTRALAHSPLRLLSTRPVGSAARVFVTSYGGGLLGGDALGLRVDVGPAAHALLSSQASTKVYGSPRSSTQRVAAYLADDAVLVAAPDPLVPYAGSRFAQHQSFTLAATASLAVVDWVSGGRWARGERWACSHYESRIDVSVGGVACLHDALLLEPESGGLPSRLAAFGSIATLVLVGPAFAAASRDTLAELQSMPARTELDIVIGGSALGTHGAIVRLAATTTEHARRTLRRLLARVAPAVGDDPWAREW